MQEIITQIKNYFPDKIILELDKNKSNEYKANTITKLIGKKKIILISDDDFLIKIVDKTPDKKYILFYHDNYLTFSNDNIYWPLKTLINNCDHKFLECVICYEQNNNYMKKLYCCGVIICVNCYDKLLICPLCRKKLYKE